MKRPGRVAGTGSEWYAKIVDRRRFLTITVNGVGVIAGGAFVAPAVINSLSPVLDPSAREEWRPVGEVSLFPVGSVTKALVDLGSKSKLESPPETAVYVWRQSPEAFVVYSRSCTDLGCPVTWDPGSEWFYCPCHGGVFSKDGERKAGPPKRPLWRYATRTREGMLEIDLRSVPPMA